MYKPQRTLLKRCPWCENDPIYINYHDLEWGQPVTENNRLFEYLILEGAQAGLSWLTILRKRENYRKAFFNFDYLKVAAMTSDDEARLMNNPAIVRNRLKIHAAIVNARLFSQVVVEYGTFYNYIMTFFPEGKRIIDSIPDIASLPVSSPLSDSISADLRKRGFKFVGTTIIYAFLQATGFIDDHLDTCPMKSKNP